MSYAPIALFVYNRLDHLKRTVDALRANELASESDLIVFSDGPKNDIDAEKVKAVREYIHGISGFKSVKINESPVNNGLANSIISGVTEVVNAYGRIIVLEDDLVTSPYFLKFMNQALNFYENDDRVAGILGYIPPVKYTVPDTFFLRKVGCWGWSTWKKGWDIFEPDSKKLLAQIDTDEKRFQFDCYGSYPFYQMLKDQADGKVDSWAIRWSASVFVSGKLGLHSGKNLVSNIGYDNGIHFSQSGIKSELLTDTMPVIENIPFEANEIVQKNVHAVFYRRIMSVPSLSVSGKAFIKRNIKAFAERIVSFLFNKEIS